MTLRNYQNSERRWNVMWPKYREIIHIYAKRGLCLTVHGPLMPRAMHKAILINYSIMVKYLLFRLSNCGIGQKRRE